MHQTFALGESGSTANSSLNVYILILVPINGAPSTSCSVMYRYPSLSSVSGRIDCPITTFSFLFFPPDRSYTTKRAMANSLSRTLMEVSAHEWEFLWSRMRLHLFIIIPVNNKSVSDLLLCWHHTICYIHESEWLQPVYMGKSTGNGWFGWVRSVVRFTPKHLDFAPWVGKPITALAW